MLGTEGRLLLHSLERELFSGAGGLAVLGVPDELRVAHTCGDAVDGLDAGALLRSGSFGRLLLDLSHDVGVLCSHFFEGHGLVVLLLGAVVLGGRVFISSRRGGVDAVVDGDCPRDVSEALDVVPDASDEEHLLVGAQGDVGAFVCEQGVGKAVVNGLLPDHPRLAGHHAAELVDLEAGLGVVDLRDGPLARVEVLLELLQVCEGVVVVEQPGDAVDHHHAAGIDLHLVTCAGDDTGRAGRDAFHDDDLVAGQALDGVVDGDAGVEVAAAAIDLNGDIALALDGREILHETLGRDVEAGLGLARPPVHRLTAHDVAVEGDLALVVADAGDVPELDRRARSLRPGAEPGSVMRSHACLLP